jgi:hypothetical protein
MRWLASFQMKHIKIKRLVVFGIRDPWSWLGWSLTWDYHNIIGSVTVLTLEIGFEYVRHECDVQIKKHSYGWSAMRLG